MTFDFVRALGEWAPIRDCPGRFTLRGVAPTLSATDLLGTAEGMRMFPSPKARDAVWVARLEDGGIISYRRADGTWLHTLNTEAGFRRKLQQLEIDGDGSA